MNLRSAFALLADQGPLSRLDLARLTGLSKVTAGQLLARLGELGLVTVVGSRPGARGPNAEVYGVVGSAAYVVGLEVAPREVVASACDLLGNEGQRVTTRMPARGPSGDPRTAVESAVTRALEAAGVGRNRLRGVAIGVPGLVDPDLGDVTFSFDLPRWRPGLRADLSRALRLPVTVDNDVNLAAVAEQRLGAARGEEDFVLVWVGRGVGSAIVLGGEVRRGAAGAAGELGYLPVPGIELPVHVSRRDKGAFQRLVGEEAVLALARERGCDHRSAVDALRSGDAALVEEVARRLAVGVAAVCAVVDPRLVVVTGPLGGAGGEPLAAGVAEAVARIAPVQPRVVPSQVDGAAVLRGAHLVALDGLRQRLPAR